jgi:hypothetical protein
VCARSVREYPEGARNPGEHRALRRSNDRGMSRRTRTGEQSLEATRSGRTQPAARRICRIRGHTSGGERGTGEGQEGIRPPRGGTAPVEEKALKGLELQERSGTKQGRAGLSRRKPSGGCETLRTERSGRGKPASGGLDSLDSAEGARNLKRGAARHANYNHARPPTTVIL